MRHHARRLARFIVTSGFSSAVLLSALATAHASPAPVAAATYAVPAEAPAGTVAIYSLGVSDVPAPSRIGEEAMLHVRLAAVNESDAQPWVLDARDQTMVAFGETLRPRFAEAGGGGRPHVILFAGQRGYIDLFFSARDLGNFATAPLTWVVRRGPRSIVATTMFEQVPDQQSDYGLLWPAHHHGGQLHFGPLWCSPVWGNDSSRWLGRYRHHRRYHYVARGDGFDVFEGTRTWSYDRQGPSTPSVARSWREAGPRGGGYVLRSPPERSGEGRARGSWRSSAPGGWSRPETSESPSRGSSWSAPGSGWSAPSSGSGWSSSGRSTSSPAPAAPAPNTVGGRWRSAR